MFQKGVKKPFDVKITKIIIEGLNSKIVAKSLVFLMPFLNQID